MRVGRAAPTMFTMDSVAVRYYRFRKGVGVGVVRVSWQPFDCRRTSQPLGTQQDVK